MKLDEIPTGHQITNLVDGAKWHKTDAGWQRSGQGEAIDSKGLARRITPGSIATAGPSPEPKPPHRSESERKSEPRTESEPSSQSEPTDRREPTAQSEPSEKTETRAVSEPNTTTEPQRSSGYTPEQASQIQKLAATFGLRPGDVLDMNLAANRVNLAARNLGHLPKGETKEQKAIDSAKFLEHQESALRATVAFAQKTTGFKGGGARSLAVNAANAAKHIVNTAAEAGWTPTGPDDQSNLASAMEHLAKHGNQQGEKTDLAGILQQLGMSGRITPYHIAGAVLGYLLVTALFGGGKSDPLAGVTQSMLPRRR